MGDSCPCDSFVHNTRRARAFNAATKIMGDCIPNSRGHAKSAKVHIPNSKGKAQGVGVGIPNSRGHAKSVGVRIPNSRCRGKSVGVRIPNSRGYAKAWESVSPTQGATPKRGSVEVWKCGSVKALDPNSQGSMERNRKEREKKEERKNAQCNHQRSPLKVYVDPRPRWGWSCVTPAFSGVCRKGDNIQIGYIGDQGKLWMCRPKECHRKIFHKWCACAEKHP